MSVELDPVELGFRRPFTQEVSQVLRIRNPNSDPVAFKVKTTAPKQYCVRPNSGRIDPGSEVEVQVLLQAMKDDPPADFKCRDKFLVQSVGIPADKDFNSIPAVWTQIEQTAKGSIQEKKIRVVFLPADATTATSTPAKPNGLGAAGVTPLARSPSPDAYTPAGQTPAVVGAVSHPESRPADSKNLGEIRKEGFNPAEKGPIGTAAASVGIPTSVEELQAQLADAKAQISKLTTGGNDASGLRQRAGAGVGKAQSSVGEGARALQQQAQASGVPVQMVAGLCLVAFLLAYFFF